MRRLLIAAAVYAASLQLLAVFVVDTTDKELTTPIAK